MVNWTSFSVIAQTLPANDLTSSIEVKRIRLSKGVKAPFDGNLLSDAAVAKILSDHAASLKLFETKLMNTQEEYTIKLKYAEDSSNLKIKLLNDKYDNLLKAYDEKDSIYKKSIERLSKACKEACSRSWWESPVFLTTVGGLLVGAITGLIIGFSS